MFKHWVIKVSSRAWGNQAVTPVTQTSKGYGTKHHSNKEDGSSCFVFPSSVTHQFPLVRKKKDRKRTILFFNDKSEFSLNYVYVRISILQFVWNEKELTSPVRSMLTWRRCYHTPIHFDMALSVVQSCWRSSSADDTEALQTFHRSLGSHHPGLEYSQQASLPGINS